MIPRVNSPMTSFRFLPSSCIFSNIFTVAIGSENIWSKISKLSCSNFPKQNSSISAFVTTVAPLDWSQSLSFCASLCKRNISFPTLRRKWEVSTSLTAKGANSSLRKFLSWISLYKGNSLSWAFSRNRLYALVLLSGLRETSKTRVSGEIRSLFFKKSSKNWSILSEESAFTSSQSFGIP